MKNIKNAKKLLVWGGIGLLAATSAVTTVCLTQSDVFIIKPKKQMGIVNARKCLKNEGIYSVTEMGFINADEFKKFCEDNNPAASGLSQQELNTRIQNIQKYLFDHKNDFLNAGNYHTLEKDAQEKIAQKLTSLAEVRPYLRGEHHL